MESQYKNWGFDLRKNFEIEPSLGMGIITSACGRGEVHAVKAHWAHAGNKEQFDSSEFLQSDHDTFFLIHHISTIVTRDQMY